MLRDVAQRSRLLAAPATRALLSGGWCRPLSADAGAQFLAANAAKAGVTVTQSGLQYRVLESGPAKGAHPQASSPCSCHYKGTFIDGTEFDSSYARGMAAVFTPVQVAGHTRAAAAAAAATLTPRTAGPGHPWLEGSAAANARGRQVGAGNPSRHGLRRDGSAPQDPGQRDPRLRARANRGQAARSGTEAVGAARAGAPSSPRRIRRLRPWPLHNPQRRPWLRHGRDGPARAARAGLLARQPEGLLRRRNRKPARRPHRDGAVCGGLPQDGRELPRTLHRRAARPSKRAR